MENTVASPTVTENQEKDGSGDIDEYEQEIHQLFDASVIRRIDILSGKIDSLPDKVNKIEKALVTNIKSDITIVKELVADFCRPKYMREHVKNKVECIREEVNGVINYLNDREKEKKQKAAEREKNGKEEEEAQKGAGIEERGKSSKKLIKTSEWLHAIAEKTEKIKKLVAQFGSLRDEDDDEVGGASSSTSTTQKKKTLSDTTECHYMCIEESLLISPMIASLKKSYRHLPPELRFCLLSLAAFPENFIIKKRPLIYWWMAEGFVAATKASEEEEYSMSAEEVGEKNFTQLIRHGLIQPWYEGNIIQPNVQGCRVHPWIRRMLVSIAMEAQLLEFFNTRVIVDNLPRSRRVCLYDDGEGVDEGGHDASWKTRNRKYGKFFVRLTWQNARAVNEKREKAKHDVEFLEMPKDLNQVSARQTKLSSMFQKSTQRLTALNTLLAEVISRHEENKQPWSKHEVFSERLNNVTTRIQMARNDGDGQNNINLILKELHGEQMQLLNDIGGLQKQVEDKVIYLFRLLDPGREEDVGDVYNRSNNCETLQNNEDLFRGNNLNKRFPNPMMKPTSEDVSILHDGNDVDVEKLLGIINVNQSYLNMDMKQEWFGKMKKLRILHLGRWRDSFPIPHIELEDQRTLEALFPIAKHLKYLSLRGISRITELPSTISRCCNLQILDLKACYNLEKLPSEIASLSKLTHFDVSECYLLQNTNLWSLVEKLELLQTLKGLKLDGSSPDSLNDLTSSANLRKLSIILTSTTFHVDLSTNFDNLRVLTITWRTTKQPQSSDQANKPAAKSDGSTTRNPPHQQPEKSENPAQQQQEKSENPAQKQPEKSDDQVKGIEALSKLKKLDVRCYPHEAWPQWLNKNSSLETLYITGGNIKGFPKDDLDLQNLQVLRFKYLANLKSGESFNESQLKTKFPSLKYQYIKRPK